jgi:hypothetical protein
MHINDRTLDEINKCRLAARKMKISPRDAVRLVGQEKKRLERDFDPIPFLMQIADEDLKKAWGRT